MESTYKTIDVENWKRAMHYRFFRNAENAQYSVSYNVDITKFLQTVREKSLPFYYSMIYAVTLCANRFEEFRSRIKEGKAVIYDTVSPSFTEMDPDTDLFKMVTVDMDENLSDFITTAKKTNENQRVYFDKSAAREDVYHITCLPWISFTHVSHTVSANKDNAIPTFAWGKYFEDNGRVLLPFSVQVHHSFIDGIHIGKFAEELQNYLDNFE